MRRQFLSGFGGSAGTAVVTKDEALLWTDSRYFNEAALQLDSSCWKLMKQGQPKVPSIVKFLGEAAAKQYKATKSSLKVGIDPFVHPASFAKELKAAFADAAKSELNMEDEDVVIGELDTSNANLIDPIWGEERPEIPANPFRVHPLEYAGVSIADKVDKIRSEMKTKKATMAVFCTLDDVAYLFNVRAMGDVDTCPVGIAYATVSNDEITLYCDSRKVESEAAQEHLKEVTIKSYDDIVADVKSHCETEGNKVWVDTSRSNLALSTVIPKNALVNSQNAVTPMKACKNEAEMEGMRKAHIVDGAAMAHFMAWLEIEIVEKGRSVSEVEIDEVLTGYRAEQPGFLECSFPTIAGVGSNAAIIHYRAKPGDLMQYLDMTQPILIDSGGQYEYGTTDVTRTWHMGEATPEFKDVYTRVLKGHIGVDTAIFPEKTPGFVLDVFARKALWEDGKDYGHGK
jgi:Xaa-Pro aminopeptidase